MARLDQRCVLCGLSRCWSFVLAVLAVLVVVVVVVVVVFSFFFLVLAVLPVLHLCFICSRMKDCGEDILVDMSEILFNELAFFRLMKDLDG